MVSPLDVLACSMAYCIVLNGLPDEPSPLVSEPTFDTLICFPNTRFKLRNRNKIIVLGIIYFKNINFLTDYFSKNNIRHNVSEFFYDLPKLISQSDIVISRAGASTLSEMAICGKPCIFIPLPNTLDGDQEHNARNFELANAAIVCDQNNLNPESLSDKILELINDSNKREKLSINIKSLGMPNASSNIADFAEKIIG